MSKISNEKIKENKGVYNKRTDWISQNKLKFTCQNSTNKDNIYNLNLHINYKFYILL